MEVVPHSGLNLIVSKTDSVIASGGKCIHRPPNPGIAVYDGSTFCVDNVLGESMSVVQLAWSGQNQDVSSVSDPAGSDVQFLHVRMDAVSSQSTPCSVSGPEIC